MLIGIFFIAAGVLIWIYPKILAVIVSSILIFMGTTIVLMSLRFRRASREWQNPFMKFFFRF
jgi:cytochrome c biogenesis protein CcdA